MTVTYEDRSFGDLLLTAPLQGVTLTNDDGTEVTGEGGTTTLAPPWDVLLTGPLSVTLPALCTPALNPD